MFVKLFWLLLATILVTEALGKATMYKRNGDNIFEPVMIPVSSTVIPLPVYKVGLNYNHKNKKAQTLHKPDGTVKLITVKKKEDV